jgi:signal transduction histidine kinase/CheY-like chemotaxis protein/HPt (histidine-containing phosphotransfer) domain-containing protein
MTGLAMKKKNRKVAKRRWPFSFMIFTLLVAALFSAAAPFSLTSSSPSAQPVAVLSQEESEAVAKALAGRKSLVFGVMESSECFYQNDGSIDGYAVLLAKWLGDLFGLPVRVNVYSWKELVAGIKSGAVDFTSDFTPMGAQSRGFIMTRPLMERVIKFALKADAPPLEEIARYRALRVGFLHDSVGKNMAVSLLSKQYGQIDTVACDSVKEGVEILRRRDIDLFVADSSWIERFRNQSDIVITEARPLMYKRMSITTGNPALSPLIAAINGNLSTATRSAFYALYHQGEVRFYRKMFIDKLDKAEREYYEERVRTGIPIPIVASPTNYPIEFYNEKENRWDGVAFDILQEISEITGLTFKPVKFGEDNWPLLLKMVKSNDPDAPMFLDMAYNETRRRDFLLADQPYLKDYYALISKNDLESLRHSQVLYHRIGLLQDSAYADIFHQWFPSHADTASFGSQREEFTALKNGDIELLMLSQFHFSYITNYLKETQFKINLVFEDPLYTGFGFNKEQSELRGIVSKAQRLVDTQRIVRRWEYSIYDFQSEATRTRITLLTLTCLFMLAIISLLTLFLIQRRRQSKRLKSLVNERTRELAEQVRATEAANEAKGRFLANMSHEIRTPLNAVIGLSELMLNEEGEKTERARNLGKIQQAGSLILSMVNDILDISKIESDKLELAPVAYETDERIAAVASMNLLRGGGKDIRFVLDMDEQYPKRLYGDDIRLTQVFNNLLSNAFKYTRQGEVCWSLACERDGDAMWITSSVRDTGIGIRPEDVEKLFVNYNQVDIRANRAIEGTGLGLAIAKRLLEMMDGSISVESEYGKGSVFTVRFRQGFVSDETIGRDVVEDLKNFRFPCSGGKPKEKLEYIRLPEARVLVVDDVETNLDVAKGMLKPYGMRVDCLASGEEAVAAIREGKIRYDAIFMDHMMPGINGVEALQRIRALGGEYATRVPVIVLTANVLTGNEQKFLAQGFQDFLGKPTETSQLDAIVRKWVAKQDRPPTSDATSGRSGQTETGNAPRLCAGPVISGLDLEKALSRFGGDEQSLAQVLHSYTKHTPGLLRRMVAVSETDLGEYVIAAHGVKGSSYGIGASALGDKAAELERAARGGDSVFVAANTVAFIAEAERLMSEVNALLSGMNADKPERAAPDPAVLARLRASCQNYDMDGVDRALDELESHRYASGQELTQWLREQAEEMNLAAMAARLAALVGPSGEDAGKK